jgi:hypothetical protein
MSNDRRQLKWFRMGWLDSGSRGSGVINHLAQRKLTKILTNQSIDSD